MKPEQKPVPRFPCGPKRHYNIYLGESDTRADDRDTDPAALAQGASRHQRGLNTFNAAKKLAQAHGWTFNWRLLELPGVGHNAKKMFAAPQASEALAP